MLLIRLFFIVLAIAFAALLGWAQLTDSVSLSDAFMAMFETPWATTAIADLYIGFFLMALVIIMVERKLIIGLLWTLPIFLAGNIVTLLWFAVRFPEILRRLRK